MSTATCDGRLFQVFRCRNTKGLVADCSETCLFYGIQGDLKHEVPRRITNKSYIVTSFILSACRWD